MERSSRLSGFYKQTPEERAQALRRFAGLTDEELQVFSAAGGLTLGLAEHMIENVVGVMGLPLGIATNFLINGKDYLIPMAVEEPSIVAGASLAARLVRDGGGFHTYSTEPVMIGQVQVLDVPDPWSARFNLLAAKDTIIALANEQDPVIVGLGGGARDLDVRVVEDSPVGPMLVLYLYYDTRDAMGANTVNTALEAIAPLVSQVTGGRVHLRILSNLADRRLASAKGVVPAASLAFGDYTGEQVAQGIVEAWAFAYVDPYRSSTHNKGVMNGIDPVVIATGNDWRAIEAGAHTYAARSGVYRPLTTWQLNAAGDLVGTIELPMAVGIVGGATRVHPAARVALKLLGVKTARELAEVIAAVGLAQNLAAVRALATEGIQRGHMKLHARQVAVAAGAEGEMIDRVVQAMLEEKTIRIDRAKIILERLAAQK